MPYISKKGFAMPESPIRKLVPFAEKAIAAGKEVIHLNIGQPDIKTPQVALEAIRNLNRDVIEYSHSAGYESYRRGLAEYYQKNSIDITFEDILVTNGGSEAIIFAMMTCFNPEDEVIVPEPFYANYNGFALEAGVVLRPITTYLKDSYALPPIEKFRELITARTRGIIICNPGNPTGYLYTKNELETLKQIVVENDLFLFADEVYREFCYDGREHFSILNLEGLERHAVVVDSVSKRYSMCGARVGAMISRNRNVMNTALKFAQARLSPPTLGQIAGEAALKTPDSYFTDVIEEYLERRDLLVDGLNSISGVTCPKPGGAFYAMAELPVDSAEIFCQWILESFEHKGATVMMAPAAGFYATPGLGAREVRLAYVLEQSKLLLAIEVLKAALIAYPGKIELSEKVSTAHGS
ncbi:MAG: aminotransferase class I/II-fold pyridoxal phosphate-dependent enzyme [Bacteroidetes bacterium]|nr:aminotransferase class I/II-fold pyridoxal phosphate-dependent enzyme [Bacteroidota bacterium]